MQCSSAPLVSVVTPVYNGGRYLAQCLESVSSQTYDNWEYLIVDNCSTDETAEIAADYGRREPRIRVICNPHHLKAVANWNHSMWHIAPASKYCKIVHADDWLFPDCLSKMVECAEANPSAALVSSYVLLEKSTGKSRTIERTVLNADMPYPGSLVQGKEAARAYLQGSIRFTFVPSSLLIRSDVVRSRSSLFDQSPEILSATDCHMGLEILEHWDLAFVHQVLTGVREHLESLTQTAYRLGVTCPETLRLLSRFGHTYLADEEYDACWKREVAAYGRFLGRSMFALRGKEFWNFQRTQWQQLGCEMNFHSLCTYAAREVLGAFAQPFRRIEERWRLTHRRPEVSS